MTSYSQREILAWSAEEVTEKVATEILLTSQYSEAFMQNGVDGVELLDLQENDLIQLGISMLKHKKVLLRWIAASVGNPATPGGHAHSEVPPMHSALPNPEISLQEIEDNNMKSRMWMPSASSTHNSCQAWYPTVSPGSVIRINPVDLSTDTSVQPWSSFHSPTSTSKNSPLRDQSTMPTYDRIYKTQPSGEVPGKKFLHNSIYHMQYHLFKNNVKLVRSWFFTKSDPQVEMFFNGNFKRNYKLQGMLKEYIAKKIWELDSLIFEGVDVPIRWQVDDIYKYFLERKHYRNGKGAAIAQKRAAAEVPASVPWETKIEDSNAIEVHENAIIVAVEKGDLVAPVKTSERLAKKRVKTSHGPGICKGILPPTGYDFTLKAKETIAMFIMHVSSVNDVYKNLPQFMKDKNIEYRKKNKTGPFQKYTTMPKNEQLQMVVMWGLKWAVKLVGLPSVDEKGVQHVLPQNVEYL